MSLRFRRTIVAGAIGVLPWFVAQSIAFVLAAGGDGWNAPFFFTLPLLIVYPIVSIRWFAATTRTTKLDWLMACAGVALDLLLIRNVLEQESPYFVRAWKFAGGVVAIWLVLWVGWQLLAIATLLKKARPRTAS